MSKWEMVMIEDICSLITDGTHQTPVYADKGYIFLSSKNVTNGSIDWSNVKYTGEELHAKLYKRLSPQLNDILLAKNGTTGVAAIVDKDIIFDIYVSLALLRPSDKIISTYFVYAINNPYTKRKFDSHLKGIGVPNLHLSSIKKTTIPLPPLDEQEKIAKNLDLASDIVKLHKQSLAELDALIQSVFYDMFGDPVTNEKGWEVKKLGEIAGLITKGSSPNWQGVEYKQSGVLFITSENVREGYLDLSKPKYLDSEFNKIQSRSILQKGDFLINIVGASIGRAAIYNLEEDANINQAVALVRVETLNQQYLLVFLNSSSALNYYSESQVSVARANLSLKNISDMPILNPPLPLQQKFARIVTEIEKQKQKVQNALTEAETLYNALMQEYFE